MPLGDEERDEGEGDSRNQDDNRRVGAVMHDAQIRAIIPITVQIIVRELVAVNASPPPKHNRHARLRTATTRGPSRYRPTESWVEANFGCDFGLEIARMKEIERRCAFETDISTWQLRFDSLPDNVAVSPRSRMSWIPETTTVSSVAVALTTTSTFMFSPLRYRYRRWHLLCSRNGTLRGLWDWITAEIRGCVLDCKINFRLIIAAYGS